MMNTSTEEILKVITDPYEAYSLFPGIDLIQFTYSKSELIFPEPHTDDLFITYCRNGHIKWKQSDGSSIHLGQGDYAVHPMTAYAEIPNSTFEGMILILNPDTCRDTVCSLIDETGITVQEIRNKFCSSGTGTMIAGNEQTDRIFSLYYDQPVRMKESYQKLMTLELMMHLCRETTAAQTNRSDSSQIETIREVHDYLLQHMDMRITIDMLSRKFAMNPTTLKQVFKEVYGSSLAAHIKEHRMELAAQLLRESDMTMAEIARAVGYDSQSKFSAAFKAYYNAIPSSFRK